MGKLKLLRTEVSLLLRHVSSRWNDGSETLQSHDDSRWGQIFGGGLSQHPYRHFGGAVNIYQRRVFMPCTGRYVDDCSLLATLAKLIRRRLNSPMCALNTVID